MDRPILRNEDIVKEIKKIINEHYYFNEVDNDIYVYEIYADYSEVIETNTIKELFDSDNPKDKLNLMMNEWYFECECNYESEMIDTIKKFFYKENNELYLEDYKDAIVNWVQEHIVFNYPFEHFFKQDVCVDIIVDIGDGNYDFTRNELFGCIHSESGVHEHSSMVWLIKQQGYSEEQINDFVVNENMYDSKFLKSVYDECLNTTTCINALSFFVMMSIEDCINLFEMLKGNNVIDKGITISKNTPCGLYDMWNGAGSLLEIKLEKNVILPFEFVDSAYPDGCCGYGIQEIYGLDSSFWKGNCIKVN